MCVGEAMEGTHQRVVEQQAVRQMGPHLVGLAPHLCDPERLERRLLQRLRLVQQVDPDPPRARRAVVIPEQRPHLGRELLAPDALEPDEVADLPRRLAAAALEPVAAGRAPAGAGSRRGREGGAGEVEQVE